MAYFVLRMEEPLGGVSEHTDTAVTGNRISDDLLFFPGSEAVLTLGPTHLDRSDENRGITGAPPKLIDGYEPAGSFSSRAYPNLIPACMKLAGYVPTIEQGNGTLDIKTLTITGTPTGGNFTLSFGGESTYPLPWNATPAQVQAALEALRAIRPGGQDIAATGTALPAGSITLTFKGKYACTVVGTVTANSGGLTGGTTPTAAVANTTPGTTGTVLDPDGAGLPAGAYKATFTKRRGPLAATAEILAGYEEENVYILGNGFGISQLTLSHDGAMSGEFMGIYERTVPNPAHTPAYDSLDVRPLRRGDLTLSWGAGGAHATEWSMTLANSLERADYLGGPASYFPKALEHTGAYPAITGSITKRSLSQVDWESLCDARTFSASARFIGESHIGATGKPYGLWIDLPACQHVGGDPAAISNTRRFGQTLNWEAPYSENAGYDHAFTVVCGVQRIESYT